MTQVEGQQFEKLVLARLKEETATIPGIERFVGSARGYVHGEIALEDATRQMMEFFDGDLIGGSDHRQRLVELAKQLNPRYGTVSVMILTFMTCSPVLSCAGSCGE
ncbi:hypothetical protein [Actinoplanes sp. RD1]|uniref:hypothetical protein n=1 Tax=Actinoplanes sp. RD1 TaxID=3064538 RepID=UPI0027420125|nr:hypothetical protein [Actinoplanes sp. RD1]